MKQYIYKNKKILALSLSIALFGCTAQDTSENNSATATVQKSETQYNTDYLTRDVRDDIFYFVMPDRFYNGDTSNDMGDITKPESYGGFNPKRKGFFHGGDIKGLEDKLDYLENLGITAIWMTPILRNQAVQGDMAGYHGYWVLDFTEIDPHLGSNQDLKHLIDAAHKRGMKVFFDIITNHTADVIKFKECHGEDGSKWSLDSGLCEYKSQQQVKNGDKYTVIVPEHSKSIKVPQWLNDPKFYHNQGDSTWQGESAVYGDFSGLDDVDTDNPEVVSGMIDIFKNIVTEFKPDGFRVDTVKHVNTEFWADFSPAIIDHAKSLDIPNFHIFGEVYSGDVEVLSHYTTAGKMPAILDFGFQGAAYDVFINETGTDKLKTLFDNDDHYNDGDSRADMNPTFIGNHDMGRFAHFLSKSKTPLDEQTQLEKVKLAHALMYFSRGIPVVYYGDEQGFVGKGGDMDSRQDMMQSKVKTYTEDKLLGTELTAANSNFDESHPLFNELSQLAKTFKSHKALRQGVHHNRAVTTDGPGLYAFSRVELDNPVEYLVLFNTSNEAIKTKLDSTSDIYSDIATNEVIKASSQNKLTINLAPLSYRIFKADSSIKPTKLGQLNLIKFKNGDKIQGDINLSYQLDKMKNAIVPVLEMTTEISLDGSEFTKVSFDNTLPLTAQFDVSDYANGSTVKVKSVVTNFAGETSKLISEFTISK
ncbi:alpha-amylase [Pseudoalteromonas sp. C2R02]|uniref:alpha-amylase family glycosyl hydrolase n=1 Tax=Pseudoalteromonas sp. C2R02 TaxID=2841565 RepID=UPI001C08AAEB|nr:alpha-amylase family glycosyl hydrolase [Pseudoalteromonas sp. C2R02]MBU2968878.1 alpha-amylase [Pseudoalteromonas sp. C2R02]